jgi:hypothetical protein
VHFRTTVNPELRAVIGHLADPGGSRRSPDRMSQDRLVGRGRRAAPSLAWFA